MKLFQGNELRFAEPRSAYIHIPFCSHRCGYCNFTLVAKRDDLLEPYLEAIRQELAGLVPGRPVETLYLGGGTPTYPPTSYIERVMAAVRTTFALAAAGEFSVEANPIDVTPDKLEVLRTAGVNRLSLGAQSFDPNKLRHLERDHNSRQIVTAVHLAREYQMSVSLDLIFGSPSESLETWTQDLQLAVRLRPDHISCYGLTYERGTSFYSRLLRRDLDRTNEDLEAKMYEHTIEVLECEGYEHYEVSNFAKPGFRSKHNEAYWLGRPYYAFGAGAARFVNGRRETNHRSTTTYIQRMLTGRSPVYESECLDPEDAARERLVFGLRRLDGLNREHFCRETGFSIDELAGEVLRWAREHGFLQDDGVSVRLARRGLLVSDAIWPKLLRR